MRSNIKYFFYICDDCGRSDFCSCDSDARKKGWSVSCARYLDFDLDSCFSYKHCWCSNCAVNHRRGRPRKVLSSSNS